MKGKLPLLLVFLLGQLYCLNAQGIEYRVLPNNHENPVFAPSVSRSGADTSIQCPIHGYMIIPDTACDIDSFLMKFGGGYFYQFIANGYIDTVFEAPDSNAAEFYIDLQGAGEFGISMVAAIDSNFALCNDTVTKYFYISPCGHYNTSINNLSAPGSIQLYPDPANDYAVLQLKQDIYPLRLQIIDLSGRVMSDMSIATVAAHYTFSTASLSSGIYYVFLYNSEERIFGQKLAVIK